MGKRSNFKRVEKDFYPTPKEAIPPLLPHLAWYSENFKGYVEPCAGAGDLINHLNTFGLDCVFASDIESKTDSEKIAKYNALDIIGDEWVLPAEYIITNPPWSRGILHPMIEHFQSLLPTWLLFDSDWMHTKQAIPYLKHCSKIVSVGRLKWIPDSKHTGKDDCAWYFFDKNYTGDIRFYGRMET